MVVTGVSYDILPPNLLLPRTGMPEAQQLQASAVPARAGLGVVSPLGTGVDQVWQRLVAGESGISRIPYETLPEASTQA